MDAARIGLAAALLAAGCASAPEGVRELSKADDKRDQIKETHASGTTWTKITPFTEIDEDFVRAREANQDYSDAYTRLVIRSTNAQGDKKAPKHNRDGSSEIETFPYNPRSLLARLFLDERHTVNLTVSVNTPSFQATVPLVTIDHESSSSSGEKFARTVVHGAQQFPLFLVRGDGSNGIASVRFQVRATGSFDSHVAAAALQVTQKAAKAAAPPSSVVTSLTEQRGRNVANSIDEAVNQLFANDLTEGQWIDRDIREWNDGVRIEFRIPQEEGDIENVGRVIGYWYVKFEKPRPSIFADWHICDPKKAEPATEKGAEPEAASTGGTCILGYERAARVAQRDTAAGPGAILQFPLIQDAQELGTVAAFLQQQPWWQSSIEQFARDDGDVSGEAVSTFCQNIKLAISAIGLNKVDAGIVTNAVRLGMPLPAGVAKGMNRSAGCAYRFPERAGEG